MIRRIRIFLLMAGVLAGYFSLAFAEDFRYDSHGKRDPFISQAQEGLLTEKELGANQLRLEGIVLQQGEGSYAIVNGEVVKEGDVFAGFKVLKIKANQAIFKSKEGEKVKVILNQDEVAIQKYLRAMEEPPAAKKKSPVQTQAAETSVEGNDKNTESLQNLAKITRQKLLEETPKTKAEDHETGSKDNEIGSKI